MQFCEKVSRNIYRRLHIHTECDVTCRVAHAAHPSDSVVQLLTRWRPDLNKTVIAKP
jgi:hypothetical protein